MYVQKCTIDVQSMSYVAGMTAGTEHEAISEQLSSPILGNSCDMTAAKFAR
jgi:hypothetical protein